MVLREALPAEVARCDELVSRFENHRLVHRSAWIRSLEAAGCGRPVYLVFEKSGEIVGCLPGLLSTIGPLRLFGSPLPGWQTVSMGPASATDCISTGEIFSALVPFLEQRYGVHHIEVMYTGLDHQSMAALGFRGEPVPTFRAPLFPGDEARMMKALKDNARRNVRRGIKLGLVVRFEHDERFVDEHYDQLREVYLRGGHAVPFAKRRVLECFRQLHASGNLLAVSVYLPDGTTNIATGTFLLDGRELLLWMWAHRTQYRWYRPTELMTWTVMRRAMEAGCRTFDLMGRGDFKKKFGAELDERKYRWVRSRYKWLDLLRTWAEGGYRWQQAARGRLARLLLRPSAVGGGPTEDHETDGDP